MTLPTKKQLNRRSYLKTTGLAAASMVGLAGCTGDPGDGGSGGTSFGTLSTSVTDQPNDVGDFESLTVTIDGIWIKPAGGSDEESDDSDEETNETEDDGNDADDVEDNEETNETNTDEDTEDDENVEDGEDTENNEDAENEDDEDDEDDGSGRRYIEFEEPQDADLVQLQGSSTALIDETEVETGDYEFLQLDVASTEGVLTDGSDADVRTPGNAPLKFNTSFEVRADETTRFIADFAPNRTGNGRYIIRPVASSTTVLYGDEEYDGGEDGEADDDGDDDATTDESEKENGTTDGDSQSGTSTNETN